jgi:hypothetical protein
LKGKIIKGGVVIGEFEIGDKLKVKTKSRELEEYVNWLNEGNYRALEHDHVEGKLVGSFMENVKISDRKLTHFENAMIGKGYTVEYDIKLD